VRQNNSLHGGEVVRQGLEIIVDHAVLVRPFRFRETELAGEVSHRKKFVRSISLFLLAFSGPHCFDFDIRKEKRNLLKEVW
jgi:hypothetical protein